ncbi:MAG: homoserine kinase [Bacteroidia bacterium]|nr:homoserine kinase [Bacteroidia bacterium]NNM22407.1 homoserine kinase [Flavobacteriaceae bacterium]
MNKLHIFSPATVANVSCGFDAMAFALENLGDEMIFEKNESGKVTISVIEGADLPKDPEKNVAGVVAQAMLDDSKADFGVDIQIIKTYKPGSGMGSSAASSAGAAFAINKFLKEPYSTLELVKFAQMGELAACGAPIADNVSAVLYGGFVLIRSYEPLDVISIPTPAQLYVTLIHPQIKLGTKEAREVLPKSIDLQTAVSQWSNVGGLISGLYAEDFNLIGRSMQDAVAEPVRKHFIPHFDALKAAALAAGALGAGISGSGPSVFALSEGDVTAEKVKQAFDGVYKDKGIDYKLYVSKVGKEGVKSTGIL